MSLRDDSKRAAILKALSDEIGAGVKSNKAALKDAMDENGIDSLGCLLDDGTRVAKVTQAGGKTTPQVTDMRKFAAWVEATRPDEIVTEVIKTVRDGTQNAILADIAKRGAAVTEQGDLIPGVTFVTGSTYLTVTYEKDGPGGQELIKQAWQRGEIDLPSLLALPAPPPGPAASSGPVPRADYDDPQVLTSHLRTPFGDEYGFLDPERAAAHATIVQGGFSTPPIEAYRMIRDGGVGAERARTWLAAHGLDPDDPARGKNTPWPLPAGGDGDG
jgi:hypothetical protein